MGIVFVLSVNQRVYQETLFANIYPMTIRRITNFNPVLSSYESQLTDWFNFDIQRPKRERPTAKKLYEQLILEGYKGSYCPVARFMNKLKQSNTIQRQAFIPIEFELGDAVQFDLSFGEDVIVSY